jgi:hypothetical protein
MKRLLVLVAGLSSFAQVRAQEGTLAPTVPVVPAPVVQNGNLTPAGGNGGWGASTGPRLPAFSRWSPFRNPATASVGEPVGTPSGYGYPVPPLPAGVGGADGRCGPGGCAPTGCAPGRARGHDGSCWEKLKNWLCYHPTKTELPKLCPTPYYTPLQGMFPCTPGGCGAGCGTCAGGYAPGQPWFVYPGAPAPPPPPPMQPPVPPGTGARANPGSGAGTSAAAVTFPPRGVQGAAVAPTWQGRVAPMPATPGIAGYRFAAPEAVAAPPSLPGTVVPTGGSVPQR